MPNFSNFPSFYPFFFEIYEPPKSCRFFGFVHYRLIISKNLSIFRYCPNYVDTLSFIRASHLWEVFNIISLRTLLARIPPNEGNKYILTKSTPNREKLNRALFEFSKFSFKF